MIVKEADISDKILKDPSKAKRLMIAWRHDNTLPRDVVASIGPEPRKPDQMKIWEAKLVKKWSDMIESTLLQTNYGDLSRDMKYADWLTGLYIDGGANWEDISGEGGDALGAWHALSVRSQLLPKHQDLRRFKELSALQQIFRENPYRDQLDKIKNTERVEKMKRSAQQIVLIDNDRFWVAIPLNYGSCYVFNNTGNMSNFCTGSSSGLSWFSNYSRDGVIISIIDKPNMENEDGKWQLHAPTGHIVNSHQDRRNDVSWNDRRFSELFPGLLKQIANAIMAHAAELKKKSIEIFAGGYNAAAEVDKIKFKFPISYASQPENEDDNIQQSDGLQDAPVAAVEPEAPDQAAPATDEPVGPFGRFQRFLTPDFVDNLNPTRTDSRRIAVYRTDGRRMKVTATNAMQALLRIEADRPEWLMPNSIRKISKALTN